ncbi:MAG: DUF3368 domain-containing protein [Planctomycetota bacterium]
MIEPLAAVDSGPLIGLARIGQLELLHRLTRKTIVPPAVWSEVTANAELPGAAAVMAASWIIQEEPDQQAAGALRILLGRGEAEAIALAQSLPGCLFLVDDARARRIAERMNIRCMGTLGLLRRAKECGMIDALRPFLEALQANGVYITQALADAVLRKVGE